MLRHKCHCSRCGIFCTTLHKFYKNGEMAEIMLSIFLKSSVPIDKCAVMLYNLNMKDSREKMNLENFILAFFLEYNNRAMAPMMTLLPCFFCKE